MVKDEFGMFLSTTNAAHTTAQYYFNGLITKEKFDAEFRKNHPVRKREDGESFEEYDDYLTRHAQTYEELLAKKNLGNLMQLDINLTYALTSLVHSGRFVTHPNVLTPTQLDNSSIGAVSLLYDLGEFLDIKKYHKPNIHVKALINKRKTWHKWASDIILFLTNPPNKSMLVEVANRFNPTFISNRMADWQKQNVSHTMK